MSVQVTNNAVSTLASGITAVATSLSVSSSDGALFPSLSGSQYFYATLVDGSNNIEIIKVTARSGDTFSTIERAQDGTSANAYSTGDVVALRPVAALFDAKADLDGAAFTGDISTTGNAQVDGNLTVDGNTTLGNASGDTVTFNGNTIVSAGAMDVSGGVWEFDSTPTSGGSNLQTASDVTAEVSSQIASLAAVPTGAMFGYGGATAPSGYLLCDGSAVSRTTYADLFAAIGTAYGVGDGSTTFNLPDGEGNVLVGADGGTYSVGDSGGSTSATISIPLKDHTHFGAIYTGTDYNVDLSTTYKFLGSRGSPNNNNHDYRLAGLTTGTPNTGQTSEAGDDPAPTISAGRMQPYIVSSMIIKT